MDSVTRLFYDWLAQETLPDGWKVLAPYRPGDEGDGEWWPILEYVPHINWACVEHRLFKEFRVEADGGFSPIFDNYRTAIAYFEMGGELHTRVNDRRTS